MAGRRRRLLIVGSAARGSLECYYARAFSTMPHVHVSFFDVNVSRLRFGGMPLVSRGVNRLSAGLRASLRTFGLLRYLARTREQFETVIVFKGTYLSLPTLQRARRLQPHAVWVNINPDSPFNVESKGSTNAHILASIRFYDVYCIWSKALVRQLETHGCKHVLYLPFGYDQAAHVKPSASNAAPGGRIVFFGAWDREREAVLSELAEFDLHIYGYDWDRVARDSPLRGRIKPVNIYGAELATTVSGAMVSLNLLRPQNAGAHNMRTFEIPAMGGLMVTTRSDEQNEWFPDGAASLMFSDVNELKQRVREVSGSPAAYDRVRKLGEERVLGHTYEERARTLLARLCLLQG